MSKKVIFIAVLCGLAVSLMVAGYLSSVEEKYKTAAEKLPVLIAGGYLEQGTVLNVQKVQTKMVPRDYVLPLAINGVEEILDDNDREIYMIAVPIMEGEQITKSKLNARGIETGISIMIPQGMRAMTLIMGRKTIGGLIQPGDTVDVIGTFSLVDSKGNDIEEAITLLQNKLVLAVGEKIFGMIKPDDEKGVTESIGGEVQFEIPVSLSVNPMEAQVLALAKDKGNLSFSLRPIGEDRSFGLPNFGVSDLIKGAKGTSGSSRRASASEETFYEMLNQMQKNQ